MPPMFKYFGCLICKPVTSDCNHFFNHLNFMTIRPCGFEVAETRLQGFLYFLFAFSRTRMNEAWLWFWMKQYGDFLTCTWPRCLLHWWPRRPRYPRWCTSSGWRWSCWRPRAATQGCQTCTEYQSSVGSLAKFQVWSLTQCLSLLPEKPCRGMLGWVKGALA